MKIERMSGSGGSKGSQPGHSAADHKELFEAGAFGGSRVGSVSQQRAASAGRGQRRHRQSGRRARPAATARPRRESPKPSVKVPFLHGSDAVNRRLKIVLVIGGAFFFLWVALKAMGQDNFWPLLAAPILLSAWYFYEAGALLSLLLTGLLLVQTPFEKSPAIIIALVTFASIALGLGWGQRRQKLAHRHTLRSSITDSLTGLYNYGFFMDCLDREMHRAERYGGSVTLVMFDVDHFKQFNDRFGHRAGNEALKTVAVTLRREKRESDIAARFGGEEFVLLIPGDESAGIETAGRLRRAISQARVPVGGASTAITVSAGVASYPLGASSREELLDKVDQLLYVAKKSGRNRVSVAHRKQRLAVS